MIFRFDCDVSPTEVSASTFGAGTWKRAQSGCPAFSFRDGRVSSMEKHEILNEIRRLASANGGKPPGRTRFKSETGIAKGDWYPHLWLRWTDALTDAGFPPNAFTTKSDETLLILKLIELSRELGHFPIDGELQRKRQADSTFPNRETFRTLGSKSQRAAKVLAYCKSNEGFKDIALMCTVVSAGIPQDLDETVPENGIFGYVYLIRHGSRQEFKIGWTNNLLRREGAIGVELPEKIAPIHTIRTDDPTGVEAYWHRRFEKSRLNGEWFRLKSADIQAFKRWKKIY